MLTLITAPPRTGKSQYVVSLLHGHKEEGKRVFVTNFKQTPEQIAATGFEHYGNAADFDVLKDAVWRGDVSRWMEELPHGAVWMIDEAQDVFPQRGKDRALPEFIKLFSKHGHKDLTIYVVTQDAMQLDVHLRRNCNLTQYMTRPLNMRKALVYTFRGSQEIPNDAWRRLQVLKNAESKKKFTYRKKWQDMYVSASAHEHIKVRIPPKIFIPIIAAIVVVCLLWWAIGRLRSQSDGDGAASSAAAAVIGAEAPTAAAAPPSTPEEKAAASEAYMARFEERVKDVPWSAPAYDEFEVTDYPRPYCMSTESSCTCLSQQGNVMDISQYQCRRYARFGYFDPHRRVADEGRAPDQHQDAQGEPLRRETPSPSGSGMGAAGTAPEPFLDPSYGTLTRSTL